MNLPNILLMLELCISGQAFKIFLLSSRAHTMKAFMGRFTCTVGVSSLDVKLATGEFLDLMIFAPIIFAKKQKSRVSGKTKWG